MIKTVYTCNYCGSDDLLQDAYVPLNAPDEVQTYDTIACSCCGSDKVRPIETDIEAEEELGRPATNTEFVTNLMEISRHGPLIQAFVIQALDQFSKTVAASTPDALDTPLVSGYAWHGCAVEIQEKLKARPGA